MKKDIIYLSILLLVIVSSAFIINDVRHQSEWCSVLFDEYRRGLWVQKICQQSTI